MQVPPPALVSATFIFIRYNFYDLPDYKKGQSTVAKNAWQNGSYSHLLAQKERRKCKRQYCDKFFEVKSFNPKQFCSSSCSVICSNQLRKQSIATRLKISGALKGRPSPYKDKLIVPRLNRNCLRCGVIFITPRWQNHIYCSVKCSIADIGSRPTSPKAARAKAGIRMDIDPELYFFSRWEANFARILNLLKVKWEFQPEGFDLITQKYTPDFYLPKYDTYIEIKNFLSNYSLNRDQEFRRLYPDKNLILILKYNYIKLQEEFSPYIKNWEFS